MSNTECKMCGEYVAPSRTYCDLCKLERKEKAMHKQMSQRKSNTADRKRGAVVGLPKWMLERGNISANSQGSHFG